LDSGISVKLRIFIYHCRDMSVPASRRGFSFPWAGMTDNLLLRLWAGTVLD